MSVGPTLSSPGIGSGLDVNTLVSKLMAVESRPLTMLQKAGSALQTQVSAFAKVQSLFSDMQTKANAAVDPTLWTGTKAASSDEKSVVATVAAGAAPGGYDIQVNQLAASQMVTTAPATTLSAGKIHISLGSFVTTPAPQFVPKTGASTVDITIGPNETSLSAIRDKINAAGAGVTASIVNDASGARLSLRSTETGESNGFRITVDETTPDNDPNAGLSMLTYDPPNGAVASKVQDAANAKFSVNGVQLSTASNTATNVVDGLSLTLKHTTDPQAPVRVDVARDDEAVKKAINDFVTSYNAASSYLRTATAYNAESKTAGPLQADAGAVSLISQLRGVVNTSSSASATFTTLSAVGITMQKDGSLQVNDKKLSEALVNNRDELRKALTASGSGAADSGAITRFKKLADSALAFDGSFATRTASSKRQQDANSKAQDAMQQRLDEREKRLRTQYQALDKKMASFQALSTYVAQQFGAR